MLKRAAKNCIILLCLILAASLLSGCSGSGESVIRMDLSGPVHNLDPQFTTEEQAELILLNIGEGLVIWGEDGPRPGVAQSWEISGDGLVYTFTLRPDAVWEDGEPVLASHFLYAFRRMFAAGALSPNAKGFAMLEGADDLLRGRGSSEGLGVSAPDEATVVFELARRDASFLSLLATAPALPCREDFFSSSMGRYGLERKYILSNGPFKLERWDNSASIRLERSETYVSPLGGAKPERVILYIGREDPLKQFLDGKSDLTPVSAEQSARAEEEGRLLSVENKMWYIAFNQDDPVWGNALLRQSLACGVDAGQYESALAQGLRASRLLVPSAMGLEGHSYREAAGDAAPISFHAAQADRLLQMGLDALELERLPQTVLLYPQEHRSVMGLIQQGWQQYLDVHVYLEPAPDETLEARLTGGDFQMLLLCCAPSDANPDALFRRFESGGRENYYGYRNPRFDQALAQARQETDPVAALEQYALAERLLIADGVVIPLFAETSFYAVSQELTGVEISPFGRVILFRGASKSA